jgi:hypothetical protein
MQKIMAVITPSGSTGAATGSATLTPYFEGKLHALYVSYVSPTHTSTTVRVSEMSSPSQTFLTLAANTASGVYFPRSVLSTNAGVTVTSTSGMYPVVGKLRVAVSTATPTTGNVTVFAYIDDL